MKARNPIFHVLLAVSLAVPAGAADLGMLYDRLKVASEADAPGVEAEIEAAWQQSGSPAMDLLLQRGQAAMVAGDSALAVEHLSALIDHAPEFAEAYNSRAAAFYQQGDFGQAIDDVAHALTLDPRHFTAITGLATLLEEMDRPEGALEAFRMALAIHPHLDGAAETLQRLEAETAGQEI